MGRCPNCGAFYFLGTPDDRCGWCGKVFCEKCMPKWAAWFYTKAEKETAGNPAQYRAVGFCSATCTNAFRDAVMNYPLDEIGTDVGGVVRNLRKLFYAAMANALNGDPKTRWQAIGRVKRALEIETRDYIAIPIGLNDDGTVEPQNKIGTRARALRPIVVNFVERGFSLLALNLEKSGRSLDAADIYEKYLKMYDKARQLREKDKQVIVKRTDISVNLNALLQQLKDGGIAVVYRCPHCAGVLKIGKNTSTDSLKVCQHCGSEIETMDLAKFLKTALS